MKNRVQLWITGMALMAVAILLLVMLPLRSARNSKTTFEDMRQAVLSAVDLSSMKEADSRLCKRLYGLDSSMAAEILLYYPSSNMAVDELLLVHLQETTDGAAVAEAMRERVQTQRQNFDGYGVEQCALLDASVQEVRGNYALLCVGRDAEAARRAFLDAL